MAVRLRMKKMGRTHRPFFRVCAMDQRSPRDGRVIEELGTYDPMCPETDARVTLKTDRVDYWLSVGAQPSEKVATLIKKYGSQRNPFGCPEGRVGATGQTQGLHPRAGTGVPRKRRTNRKRRPLPKRLRLKRLPPKKRRASDRRVRIGLKEFG